jgi:hypothetical protein
MDMKSRMKRIVAAVLMGIGFGSLFIAALMFIIHMFICATLSNDPDGATVVGLAFAGVAGLVMGLVGQCLMDDIGLS